MYVKLKCCFLKKEIDPRILEGYGFKTLNEGKSYWLPLGNFKEMGWYADTRRFVIKYPKTTWYKKTQKHLKPLIANGLVEIRPTYEYWVFIGRWQNFSEKKLQRIENKIKKLEGDLQ